MKLLKQIKSMLSNESGAPTVEFVIVFPFVAATMFWLMEVGFLNLQAVQLDRGLEYAVREVMVGDTVKTMEPAEAHDFLKDIVCSVSAIGKCDDYLKLQMRTLGGYQDFGTTPGVCRDVMVELDPVESLTYEPEYEINSGSCSDSLVLVEVQACLTVETILPPISGYVRQRADENGFYELHSLSAFLNEPC